MTIAVFLGVALIVAIIMFTLISQNARTHRGPRRSTGGPRRPVQSLSRGEIHTRWQTIEAMAGTGGNGLRQAINEADKLLDHVLRQQGVSGATMGDRLKSAKSRFADYAVYDGLWRAHKLRNALAHEVGFDLVASQARDALADVKAGLKDLGAL